jgi:hypothetical protein
MADILCPNCNMPNPDDQNVCSFCRQPLRAPSDDSSIRPGDMPTKKTTAELEPILPQWLREARDQARQSAENEDASLGGESTSTQAAPPAPEPTDWLAGLEAAARDEQKEELPEWMRGPSASPAKKETKPEAKEPTLTRRQEIHWENEPAEEPQASGETQEEGLPFWMKGMEEPTEEKKEFSDWLTKQESASPPASASPFEAGTFRPQTGELRDFMSSLSGGETPSAASDSGEQQFSGDLPDWMTGPSSAQPASDSSAAASTEPGLDWLKEEASKPFAPFQPSQFTPEPSTQETFGADLNLPDWMKPAEETPVQKQEEPPSFDWLKPEAETPAAPQAEAGLPDWISSLGPPAAETPAAPQAESAFPDWMGALSQSPAEEPPAVSKEDAFSFDWLPPAGKTIASQPAESELPDWAKPAPAEPAAPPSSAPAFVTGEEAASMGAAAELFSADLPDWLSNIAPTEQKPAAQPELPAGESISLADLPSWVQAMRPVETALPEAPTVAPSPSQPAEKQGPLAGLVGVLPAASGYAPSSRPKAYSLRLQPTPDQLEHAALLEQMLAVESEPKPFRAASSVMLSQRVLRWAVAGILFLLILSLLLSGVSILPLPILSSEGTAAQNFVDALPVNAPVLMIFDYEPALAGEMETVADSFVDQLISLHRPRLNVLSTSPTGAGLAEHFMNGSETRRNYRAAEAYANLGYLPGESAGILAFAIDPQDAFADVKDVTRFSDYELVILLTDRAETARAWVEQTTGHRAGRPLIIVSSAQSAPMIQPYLLSGQVNGLVTGLHDGAAFDQHALTVGRASRYWSAYNLSILAVCIMIVIGGLWNLALGMRSRRQGLEEG